jgi:hypothetical protein
VNEVGDGWEVDTRQFLDSKEITMQVVFFQSALQRKETGNGNT